MTAKTVYSLILLIPLVAFNSCKELPNSNTSILYTSSSDISSTGNIEDRNQVPDVNINQTQQDPIPRPPTKEGELLALDSFDKPNMANRKNWKAKFSRIVFNNSSTYIILKGNLCLIVGEARRLEPININHPSAREYQEGVYYDAITDLTKDNCKTSDFAIMDISDSYKKHGLSIKLDKLNIDAPASPSIPMVVQLEPYAFNIGINKGRYIEDHQGALNALEILASHRIQPIKSWISANSSVSGESISFMNFVGKFKNGPTNIPDGSNANVYAKYSSRPWFYVVDEPNENEADLVQKSLDQLKRNHPSVRRMVTTNNEYPVNGIDIYCPVMDQLLNRDEYKGELWSYVSCMSHGCSENRAYLDNPNKYNPDSHSRSGAPDLTIDAPSSDIFAMFLIAVKLKLGALLYYDSITQWALGVKGVDVYKDMYNFGGNGDGTLLYPDYENKLAKPSLRLKIIKEASLLADAARLSGYNLSGVIDSPLNWNITTNIRNEIYEHLKRHSH